MNVTFEILLGDLVRWRPSVESGGASLSRGFRYSLPAQGQILGASDVLYIAKGSEVVGLVDCLDGCSLPISLLCVGFPPESASLDVLGGAVVVLDTDESAYGAVVRECADLFASYAEGLSRVSDLVSRGRPLADVVKSCSEVFGRPLLLWSLAKDGILCSDPADPLGFALMKSPSVSSSLREGAMKKSCCVLDLREAESAFGGSSLLCQRICLKDDVVAVLVAEHVAGLQESRDRALLAAVARPVQSCFEYGLTSNFVSPNGLVNQIELLLGNTTTSWQMLESVLSEYGWGLLDEYLCMAVGSGSDVSLGINVTASMVSSSGALSNIVCVPQGRRLIFVANLSKARLERGEMISLVEEVCRKRYPDSKLGASLPFSELQDLHYYGIQANKALELGCLLNPEREVNLFEDHYVDFLAQCCLESVSAASLFPAGFNRLKNYERAHGRGAGLEAFLNGYIDNDFQMKATVSAEHYSRTTAFSKLRKVKEITGMDLDDHATRVALSVASRAVRLAKISSR